MPHELLMRRADGHQLSLHVPPACRASEDDKPAKRTARTMLRMVRTINDDHLEDVGEARPAGEMKVTCYTCHRGETRPLTRRPEQG